MIVVDVVIGMLLFNVRNIDAVVVVVLNFL